MLIVSIGFLIALSGPPASGRVKYAKKFEESELTPCFSEEERVAYNNLHVKQQECINKMEHPI